MTTKQQKNPSKNINISQSSGGNVEKFDRSHRVAKPIDLQRNTLQVLYSFTKFIIFPTQPKHTKQNANNILKSLNHSYRKT